MGQESIWSIGDWREKAPRAHPEADLQRAIVAHLRMLAHKNVIWFHPMNSAPVSKRTAGRFKAEGVVAGVPDLCFVLPDGRFAGMELKAPGGRLSPSQRAFQDQCAAMGVEFCVCYDIDTALRVLRAWKVLP